MFAACFFVVRSLLFVACCSLLVVGCVLRAVCRAWFAISCLLCVCLVFVVCRLLCDGCWLSLVVRRVLFVP